MASNKVIINQQQPMVVKVKPGAAGGDQLARDLANAAFLQANTGARTAFTTLIVANNTSIVANSNTSTFTLVRGTGILLETDTPNNAVIITATGGCYFDEVAREIANNAVRTGYTTIDVNGTDLIPSTNVDTLHITGAQANLISITANTETQTIDFLVLPSGVSAGTYGNTAQFIQLTVDIYGRVTALSNITPILDTSVLASGTLGVARGGTGHNVYSNGQILIANVSGALDTPVLRGGNGVSVSHDSSNVVISSTLTLPIQSKSVSYGTPLVNEIITLFYTNTAITLTSFRSVIVGTTPNATFNLIYTSSRANTSGTLIVGSVLCENTTTGLLVTSFTNALIPANNYVLLHTTALNGSVEELALTLFFSN